MVATSRPSRRRTSLLTRTAALTALLCVLGLFGPRTALAQPHAAAPFIDVGTMNVVVDNAPTDLDPASDEFYGSDNIARNINDELIADDHASISRFIPKLAVSWSSNANYTVWTFHLRHGVRFHTGRCCLTADDVKYSIGRTVLAGLSASYLFARFMTDPMKQIKIVDPYTVQFNLVQPGPFFSSAVAGEFTALILDAQALRKHATKADPWAHNYATDHGLGTGPYMIQSWQRATQVVLVRFPAYWGGWSGRHFSRIVIRTIPESTTRRELLERGAADLTYNLTAQDDLALEKNPNVVVSPDYSTEVDYIVMTEAGPLASPYARQALCYAFDYNALITGIYKGFARRAYGPVPSVLFGYDPHMFHYQTDLKKAKALFDKAGVKPGTTLTFYYADPYGPVALILQAQLAQIGINLKPERVDSNAFSSTFFGNSAPSTRPNLMPYPWWPDYNDPYDMAVTLIGSQYAGAAGANAGYYHNAQVDALLAKMKYASGEQLAAYAHQMQDITSRVDPPAIYIAEPAQVNILSKSLKGFFFNPLQIRTFYYYWLYR